MIKESEHLVPVTTQAFDETLGIGICKGSSDELVEAQMKFCSAPCVDGWRTDLPLISQAHRILEQAREFFAEAFPRGRGVELVDLDELGEQVEVAALFGQRLNGVVSAPEIGDEDAWKQCAENLLDHRGTAVAIDEAIAVLPGGEGPQPEGHPIDAPTPEHLDTVTRDNFGTFVTVLSPLRRDIRDTPLWGVALSR